MKTEMIKKIAPQSSATKDTGKVRLGNMSPAFKVSTSPKATRDSGKTRLGNMSPAFKI
ncbi:hypothetical protein [Sneathiella aquimaris]|uniref:hypothetical protein n=1 Tax=Sneathiella aquimaris TaxID=2599305 RepID=UPI00146CFE6A|nr:hypothetical protein [Sneathiella aquimaris]